MMARRFLLLLAFIGGVCGTLDVLSINYPPEESATTEHSWPYDVQNVNSIRKYYKKYFPEGPVLESLIKNNHAVQTLMEKARQRSAKLEMRLLQWADYISSLSILEKQLDQYVEHFETLESDTLLNYVEWLLSQDSGTPRGILDRIHNLVVPIFEHQGLLELIQSILTAKIMLQKSISD